MNPSQRQPLPSGTVIEFFGDQAKVISETGGEAPALQVGDTVAIRGDRRLRMDGSCEYLPEQLVDGKYVKHTGHGGVWTGKVQKIQRDEALVSGCWRHVRMFEVYPSKS